MCRSIRVFGRWCVVLMAASCWSMSAGAQAPANGTAYDIAFQQHDGTAYLADVSKQMKAYQDTTAANCYKGAAWCTKTVKDTVKLSHDHLDTDTNADINAAQKTRADEAYRRARAFATNANRTASASAIYNCHAYSMDRDTVWLLAPTTMLNKDYTEKTVKDLAVGDVVVHENDHSTKVAELKDAGKDTAEILKVEGKCGRYGRYKTGPNDLTPPYGAPVSYWKKN